MARPQTSYGRYHVAEPPSSVRQMHFFKGATLQEKDWEPHMDVLDQEDLIEQGINTGLLVPGAPTVDALGSCTANASTVALSNILGASAFYALGIQNFGDTKGAEEWAIKFYHLCTDETGDPSQEWPPTDCGSSGVYVVQQLLSMGLITGQQIASGGENIVSLMQQGGLIAGVNYMTSWEEPDAQGFVDGQGGYDDLMAAINSGVAGGHEIYLSAIEKLTLTASGGVDLQNTVIRFRNSWTSSWGDNGSARFHLSTLNALNSYEDFRLLVA